MPKRTKPRRNAVTMPIRKGAAKRSFSVYAPLTVMERLDKFIQDHGLSSRSEGIESLLDAFGAFERLNHEAANLNVAKPHMVEVTPLSDENQFDVDSWSDSEVQRLKRALGACKPNSLEQWQTVAKSIGDARTFEECQHYAKVKLKYKPQTARNKKPTLRDQQEKQNILRRLVTGDEENDCFVDAPKITQTQIPIPLVDTGDISGLSTPSSGISYRSRFILDSSSGASPLLAAADSSESAKKIRLETRKRADLRVFRMQPMLAKATTVKRIGTPPITRSKRALRESAKFPQETSQNVSWTNLRRRTSSGNSEGNNDSYFDDSTA